MQQKEYYFSVAMPYSECKPLYTGGIKYALLTADTGERVQVPAINLRPMITRVGIKGRFRLIINHHNKIISFEKISDY
mgnify:CR=1 FL=1